MMTSGIALGLLYTQVFDGGQRAVPVPIDARVTIATFPVTGNDELEIRKALRANGPRDTRMQPRDGYTQWRLGWRWDARKRGVVDRKSLRVSVDAEIRIPRCVGAGCGARWRLFRYQLVRHELRHLQFVLDGARKLAALYSSNTDSTLLSADAHRLGDRAINDIRAADRGYDRKTDHGKSEGIRW